MKPTAALLLTVWIIGCAPQPQVSPSSIAPPSARSTPTTSAAAPTASADRDAGWRSDLDQLLSGLDKVHPDLSRLVSIDELGRQVAQLKDAVPTLADDAVMVRAVGIVANVSAKGRDAHTGIYPWAEDSRYKVHSLPLRLWLFPDAIHVVDALPPYEDLIGARIDMIAGRASADVLKVLDPIVPRDNDQTVRLLLPRFLLIPEVLKGLGIVDEIGPVELGVSSAGRTSTIAVDPIAMNDYNAWAGPYGLHLPTNPDVVYLSRMDDPLWWAQMEDGSLFVQYNRVELMGTDRLRDLGEALASTDAKRVVVDIRHNFGGEVSALGPVLALFDTPKVDRPGRLFLVTGRNTFSAASLFAARLQANTSVKVVGEPMGGSPNLWGNARPLALDWSGLSVSIATQFELATTEDDDRLTIEPDISAPLTFDDWAAGRDPALVAIGAAD